MCTIILVDNMSFELIFNFCLLSLCKLALVSRCKYVYLQHVSRLVAQLTPGCDGCPGGPGSPG